MNTQTILVVDDDAEIREGIRILLTGENYTILEAESGAQALERLSEAVDLVILDVMMPGFSGLRVCEEIRKRSTVPILFLTALAQDSDKLVGLTAGGDDYLTKPLSVKTIQDIEKGRKSPSYKTVLRLMSRLGVSPNTAFLIKEPTSTEKIQFFLEYFQSCDPKSQDILLKTLYFLAEQLRNFHDESN